MDGDDATIDTVNGRAAVVAAPLKGGREGGRDAANEQCDDSLRISIPRFDIRGNFCGSSEGGRHYIAMYGWIAFCIPGIRNSENTEVERRS